MSDWLWIGLGIAGWLYLGLVAWRWDRFDPSPGEPLLIGCLLLWFLVFLGQENRPRRPWLAWEPKPNVAERIAAAQARSLELEREAGLEFDGIFLKKDQI